MNWLGAGLASILAALVGAVVGVFFRLLVASLLGVDLPPIVGLTAGIGAALASSERSGLRGILTASLAAWVAASAEVILQPAHGFVSDLVHFSDRLRAGGFFASALSAVVAFALGSRAAS